MRYVCDAPGAKTWFALESEAEADAEAALMAHAVNKYFQRAIEAARESYRPRQGLAAFERDIGLKDHLARTMPLFLTLRADDGAGLATAMLPPQACNQGTRIAANFRIVIVGPGNGDPYLAHGPAIAKLGKHFALELKREACFPYSGSGKG